MSNRARPSSTFAVGIAHAVELAEQVQELAHPQALGQRQVPGGEADVLHRLAAMTREPEAAHLDPPGVR